MNFIEIIDKPSLPYRLFGQILLLPVQLNSSLDLFFVPGGVTVEILKHVLLCSSIDHNISVS
jgi:hypothetical protein